MKADLTIAYKFIRKTLFVFLILLGCSHFNFGQATTDSTQIEYATKNAKTYAFFRHMKPNMTDARQACTNIKMELVKIESTAENDFLTKMAFAKEGIQTTDGNQYWIGASDSKQEGKWIWMADNTWFYDQKKMRSKNNQFENWGKTTLGGQPNNVMKNDEDEDCVVIRQDGSWYDIGCKKRFAYIICAAKNN